MADCLKVLDLTDHFLIAYSKCLLGEGLDCYSCNSGDIYKQGNCAAVAPGSSEYVVNCTKQGLEDGKDYQRCRVIVQDG